MRLVFMGTPDFAVPTLEALAAAGHEIVLVVTQPDRPKGRGQKLAFSPVKKAALVLGLEVRQPEKVKTAEFVEILQQIQPDAIVVVAFGQLLSEDILAIPKYGCVNLHASLLPKYRGAAPIHWALLNGEGLTGNTTMLMDKGMDTGAMLLTNQVTIDAEATTGEIHDKLAVTGAQLMIQTLAALSAGQLVSQIQEEALATYAPKLDRQLEVIDWQQSSQQIHNQIRGLSPWPGAYTLLNNQRLKIYRAKISFLPKKDYRPGQYAGETQNGFLIAASDGLLEILCVQPASKKIMPAREFIQGCNQERKKLIFGENRHA